MSTFAAKPLSELSQIKMRFYARKKLADDLRCFLIRSELSSEFRAQVSAEIYRLTEKMNCLEARWDEIEGRSADDFR